MKLRYQTSFLLVVLLSIFAASTGLAQPKTVNKKTTKTTSTTQKTKRPKSKQSDNSSIKSQAVDEYFDNILLFQVSRLASTRFPSATFSYERRLTDFLGAVATLGVPINNQTIYRESNGEFSGIEGGLGIRAYPDPNQRSRVYFQLEGMIYHNSVTPLVLVAEPNRPTFRAEKLKIKRKRQLAAFSMGYQFVGDIGITFDARAGLIAGRRGIFSEDEERYLSVIQEVLFSTGGPAQNRWGNFGDVFIGLGFGYAF